MYIFHSLKIIKVNRGKLRYGKGLGSDAQRLVILSYAVFFLLMPIGAKPHTHTHTHFTQLFSFQHQHCGKILRVNGFGMGKRDRTK